MFMGLCAAVMAGMCFNYGYNAFKVNAFIVRCKFNFEFVKSNLINYPITSSGNDKHKHNISDNLV